MTERQPTVLFELKDNPELFRMLNEYRVALGWTWKRFMLIGMANSVESHKDNPDLVLAIAEYLSSKR